MELSLPVAFGEGAGTWRVWRVMVVMKGFREGLGREKRRGGRERSGVKGKEMSGKP